MLKVVMISPLPPMETGESIYTLSLITKLTEISNIRITAITGPEANELPKLDGRVKTMCIWRGRSLTYPFSLLKAIIKERPHIVHVQFGPHGDVYGGLFGEMMIILLLLLKAVGIKTTITLHSTWMLNQVESRVSSYGFLRKISFLAKPAFRMYMKLLRLSLSRMMIGTVRVNSKLKSKFIQEYNYSDEIVDEIPHPCRQISDIIDTEEAIRKINHHDKKIILVFGYIRKGKGLKIALKAMTLVKQQIPEALLLVAGKPQGVEGEEYLSELEGMRYNLELADCVRFDSNYIPSNMIPLYFSASNIILVPYTESIGASGPIHNYAGYAKPIVASDEGYHMTETLGGTLTVFKTGNSDDLAIQLMRLLKDANLRNQLGELHRKYTLKENWTLAAKRTLHHYQRIMHDDL